MNKPVVNLEGVDSNVFMIIGLVARTLKRAGQPEKAVEFTRRAWASGSYDAVLALVFEYAEVQ